MARYFALAVPSVHAIDTDVFAGAFVSRHAAAATLVRVG